MLRCALFGAALITALSPAAAQAYIASWSSSDGGNDHYYEFLRPEGGIRWTDARDAAAASILLGSTGHLATVNSAEEWAFITEAFPENHVWIGFTDAGHEGDWRWITGEPVTFTAWGTGEPNNAGNEHYASYGTHNGVVFHWNDLSNRTIPSGPPVLGYLIEYEGVVPEPSAYAMAGLGLLGLAFLARRRLTRGGRTLAVALLFVTACLGVAEFGEATPISQTLYGITEAVGGEFSLVEVDTLTAATTPVANFSVGDADSPRNLAYHAPTGMFLARKHQSNGVPPALVVLDPVAQTANVIPITGLPDGQEKVNGVAYDASTDQIVITFGFFPTTERRLAAVDLLGNVLNLSDNLGIGDRDRVAFDPFQNRLLTFDSNDITPRLAAVADPFGTPIITPVANPPFDHSVGDLAVAPDSGKIFLTLGYGAALVELNLGTQNYDSIGNFGLPAGLTGLAFGEVPTVPEPSTYAMAGLGLLGFAFLGRRRVRQRGARLFAAILTLAACIGVADTSSAALLAYDGFNYSPVGSDVAGNSGGGSFGFAEPWDPTELNTYAFDIGGGGLSDPTGTLATTGNHATGAAFGANRDAERALAAPLGADGTTTYFSFLMQPEGVLGEGAYNGWFSFTLRGTRDDITVGRGSYNTTYGVAGVRSGGSGTTTQMVPGETRFLVLRADFAPGADTYSLFIDPVPGHAEPAIADAVATIDAGTLSRVGISGPGAFSFDELRIGTTFCDVTPVSAVPEPSTYAMAGMGLLGFAFLGRRRVRQRGARLFATLLTLTACAGVADTSSAALLAYDGFNYSPVGSDLRDHGGGGSFGFSTGWNFPTLNNHQFDVGASTLSDSSGTLPVTGNHATSVAFGANRNVERVLDTPLGVSGTTAYFSFLMRPEGVLGEGAYDGWFAFTLRGTWDLSLGRSSDRTKYSVGRAGAPSSRVFSNVHAAVGETRLFVLRADFADGADTYSMYIDPTPGAAEPLVPDAVATSFDLGTVTRVGISGPGAFSFDELRIGTTFCDVTPVSAVPEPSTYAMAGLGLAAFAIFGWRRRR